MSASTSDQHERARNGHVKVWFRFVPREGWLPYDKEGLWADQISPDTARVENVPFLVDGWAQGDVVRFETDDEQVRWATERVEASGNGTVRVVPLPSGPLGRNARAVHEHFAPFGLGGEAFSKKFPMVAFHVPAEADIGGIKALLAHGEEAGWWYYEVGCTTANWHDT